MFLHRSSTRNPHLSFGLNFSPFLPLNFVFLFEFLNLVDVKIGKSTFWLVLFPMQSICVMVPILFFFLSVLFSKLGKVSTSIGMVLKC